MKKLFKKFKKNHHGRRENKKRELNKGWKRADEEFIYLSNPMDNGQLKLLTQQQRNMQDFLQVGAAGAQLRKKPEQNGQALRELLQKVATNAHSKKSSQHDLSRNHQSSHLWR